MHLHDIRSQYRDQILALATQHKAENVRIFGSVARGDATAESDIDILVHFTAGASLMDEAGLEYDLSHLLKRKVDLLGDDVIRAAYKPYILQDAVTL